MMKKLRRDDIWLLRVVESGAAGESWQAGKVSMSFCLPVCEWLCVAVESEAVVITLHNYRGDRVLSLGE